MIYLHHYPASLFSEKIRALLGYLDLAWHSVEIAPIMPRPLLMPLSGGYRRTPVLQIGANVYSDTKIIARGLARHADDRTLFAHGFAAHRTADWADSHLFRVAVALNFRPEALGAMMGNFTPEQAEAFAKDRAQLAGDQPLASYTPEVALAYLEHAVGELEQDLSMRPFLFGDAPCIADFSVYHNLWFLQANPVNQPLLADYAAVQDWCARMSAFGGQVTVSEASGEDALAAAAAVDPEVPQLAGASELIGQAVTVTPVDYGCVPVAGTLLACDADEIVIERSSDAAGRVCNHFPQAGFALLPA